MICYDEYKAVDLPTAQKIPKPWDLKRNRYLFTEMKEEVGEHSSDYTLLSLSLKGVIPRDVTSGKGKFPEKFDKYKIVKPDYMAFCLFDMDETPRTVGLSNSHGMLTGAYTIVKVDGIYPRYAYYYYLGIDNVKALRPFYTGLRKTINISTFLGIKTPIPSIEEQCQISKFLDWQTSRLNKLINIRKKEIGALKEKRMALINETLTSGIRGSKLKPSRIGGLEFIPEDWVEKELKWYATSNDESIGGKMPDDFELNYIDISTVGFGSLKAKPAHMTFDKAPSRARRVVREGDTILSTVRTYLKSVCYIDETLDGYIASTGFSVLRPKAQVFPQLLSYAVCCDYFINAVIKNSIGTSYPAINDAKLMTLKLALPDTLKEQEELFEYITELTSSTDSLIECITKEVASLEEMKKRIIIDVTTGQIDVRNVNIPEFDFVDEIEESSDEYDEMDDESVDEEV